MFAIIDLETTGLDPRTDRIFEIAILLYDGMHLTGSYETLINPEFQLMPGIERLTGVMDRQLLDAPKFYEVARKIVELTENRILVAHNARFDYAFLRREFSRLGFQYLRKQLCTERLSRERIPGQLSYKLSYLCSRLNIPLEGHHRAYADAMATLQLFERLGDLSDGQDQDEDVKRIMKENILPPGISRDDIAILPDATGVYFFYDELEKLIYVGKSNSIRKRVLSHFSNDLNTRRGHTMKHRIRFIKYEVTGSELIALLLESDLIKHHQPLFNRSQRNTRYRYGLFVTTPLEGYRALAIHSFNRHGESMGDGECFISFSNKKRAQAFLERILTKYGLCQKLCGLYKSRGPCFNYHLKLCSGACIGEEPAEAYNQRVQQAIDQYYYDHPDFILVTKGRDAKEAAVVLVENAIYKGFGYVSKRAVKKIDAVAIRKRIVNRQDNQDIRRIINSYLNLHPQTRLIQL